MPIPPPAVRPTILMGTAASEDDVTAKLIDIVKVNRVSPDIREN